MISATAAPPGRWIIIASGALALGAMAGALVLGVPLLVTRAPAAPAAAPAVSSAVVVPGPRPPAPPPTPPPPPPKPAVVVTPSEPAVAPRACTLRVALTFPHASAVPPAGTREQLAPAIERATELPDALVIVDGHADASGNADRNLLLSKQRAHRVAVLLASAGVKNRIVEHAFGAYDPLDTGTDAVQRRVEVRVRDPHCRDPEDP